MKLLDENGQRKYLSPEERERFKSASLKVEPQKRIFALMLYYTGCRISEAINLQKQHIDLATGQVSIETLKRRSRGIYRQIPLPEDYIQA